MSRGEEGDTSSFCVILLTCGRWNQQRQATTCFKLRCLKLEEYCYEQFCSDLKLHLSLVYSIVKCSTIEKCNEDCRGGNGKRPVATDLTVRLLCFSEAARQKLLDNGVAPPVTMLVRMMMMMMVMIMMMIMIIMIMGLPPPVTMLVRRVVMRKLN